MKKTKEFVMAQVLEVLKEMSELEEVLVTPEVNPIEAFALDSGHGIPFACEMEIRLGIEIPVEVNPFIKDGPSPKARTVFEIVTLLMSFADTNDGEER